MGTSNDQVQGRAWSGSIMTTIGSNWLQVLAKNGWGQLLGGGTNGVCRVMTTVDVAERRSCQQVGVF